jgi:hypothetical protein
MRSGGASIYDAEVRLLYKNDPGVSPMKKQLAVQMLVEFLDAGSARALGNPTTIPVGRALARLWFFWVRLQPDSTSPPR